MITFIGHWGSCGNREDTILGQTMALLNDFSHLQLLCQIEGLPGVLEFLGVPFSVSLIDLNRDAVCVSQPC